MKIVKLVAVVLASALVFVGCGEKKEASGEKAITVGCEATFPPFEMTDEKTAEIIGFDIDLMKAIAADQGFTVKFQNLGFDGLIPALKTGSIDMIASGLTITEERAKQIDFSASYIEAGLAIAVADSDATVNSPADLKGKIVAVQIGTSGAEATEKLNKEVGFAKIKTYDNISIAFQELINGSVHAVINDIPVSKAFISRYPGKIKFAGDPLNSEDYGFAVAQGNNELLDKINAGLKNVKASGKYDEICNKYFK